MQEAHDSFVFARYLFMMLIIAAIIILTGVIITLGPLDITVAEAYQALIDRFYPGYFNVEPLTSRVVWNIRFPKIGRAHV